MWLQFYVSNRNNNLLVTTEIKLMKIELSDFMMFLCPSIFTRGINQKRLGV